MTFDGDAEEALIAATRIVAREEILPRFRALNVGDIGSKTDQDDLVTIADQRSEERLTTEIARILPGAAVVGEEAVAGDPGVMDVIGDAGTCVIVDPIDGTWNYANGLGNFGVILAVTERGRTVWGGIYDPLGDDWVIGRRGQGAWFRASNGEAFPVSVGDAPVRPEDCFGFVGLFLFADDERRRIASMIPDFRRIGSLRCSAHEYRLLSQGRADFNMNGALNPWDHAAGVLIYQEAGGVARMLDGSAYAPTMKSGRMLTARSEPLWSALAERFAFLGAGA